MNELRSLPSIDKLLNTNQLQELVKRFGKPLVLSHLRRALQDERNRLKRGETSRSLKELINSAHAQMDYSTTPTLRPVINASGVILHTNLGRSCLSEESNQAIQGISNAFSTLEFDLTTGERGHRSIHVETILKELLGVEDAYVVNNNAGAVLLVLAALASRKRVIVSRTQLIEIGGGFRIPDVLKQSGAKMVEIGSTNQIHIQDYEEALQQTTAVVLRAHHSNYKIIGFSGEPRLDEIVETTHAHNAIFVDDIGSGALIDTSQFGLAHEPMVQESITAGADVICFSGDKLLGGPQAGIIVGRKDLLMKIKKHPLARALRADKLLLAGLHTTLSHYLKDEVITKIPTWQMISMSSQETKKRAKRWMTVLGCGEVISAESTIGGGSLPGEILPSYVLALRVKNSKTFMQQLRGAAIPIIARVRDDKVLFDPRTVFYSQEEDLLTVLMKLVKKERRL